jgi:purine/pyrimidine-nucleoside phosphorylase
MAMSEFKNVTVIREANVYFGGNVTSRTVLFADGSKKTLGVMLPGEYEFGTAEKEIMEILSGDLEILLPGSTVWKTVKSGERFDVLPKSKFSLKVKTVTDYCCSYVK